MTEIVVGSATSDEWGRVLVHDDGGNEVLVIEDPARAADLAASLQVAASVGMTSKASRIAEEKALVGSASHHMDRGASSAFHYDRRTAALVGPPLEEAEGLPPAQAPAFAAGNSPVTGTSQESVDALEHARTGGPAGAGGAFAEPPVGAAEGLEGGPPGTVSPEPPSDEGSVTKEQDLGDPAGPGAGAAPDAAEDTGKGKYEGRTVAQLQATARKKGVSASGTHDELVARLRA